MTIEISKTGRILLLLELADMPTTQPPTYILPRRRKLAYANSYIIWRVTWYGKYLTTSDFTGLPRSRSSSCPKVSSALCLSNNLSCLLLEWIRRLLQKPIHNQFPCIKSPLLLWRKKKLVCQVKSMRKKGQTFATKTSLHHWATLSSFSGRSFIKCRLRWTWTCTV